MIKRDLSQRKGISKGDHSSSLLMFQKPSAMRTREHKRCRTMIRMIIWKSSTCWTLVMSVSSDGWSSWMSRTDRYSKNEEIPGCCSTYPCGCFAKPARSFTLCKPRRGPRNLMRIGWRQSRSIRSRMKGISPSPTPRSMIIDIRNGMRTSRTTSKVTYIVKARIESLFYTRVCCPGFYHSVNPFFYVNQGDLIWWFQVFNSAILRNFFENVQKMISSSVKPLDNWLSGINPLALCFLHAKPYPSTSFFRNLAS